MSHCTQVASQFLRNGFNVIPLQLDGSKRPIGEWKPYQQRLASEHEIETWFAQDQYGIAVVAGQISSNLHIIDFDDDAEHYFGLWWQAVNAHAPATIAKLVVIQTPRPGRQVWFRQESIPAGSEGLAYSEPQPVCDSDGNQVLDAKGNPLLQPKAFIETRGSGGYAVAVGTPNATHSTGKPYQLIFGNFENLPIVSDQEAEILLNLCRSYSKWQPRFTYQQPGEKYNGEPRPGDIYNQQVDIRQLLINAGWQHDHYEDHEHYQEPTEFLRRPGKHSGHSATLGYFQDDSGKPLLYVFTSSTCFKQHQCYDAFHVNTMLHHGGDFSTAAAAARVQFEQQVTTAQQQWHQQETVSLPLKVTPFSDIDPRDVDWLWDGRVPLGKLTLFTGDQGLGKGMILADTTARVTTGRLFPDGTLPRTGTCLWVGAEDGAEDTLRPRLDAAGADVNKVLLLEGPLPPDSDMADLLDLSAHIEKLDQVLDSRPDAVLIVIDPIMDYLGATTDSYKATDVRRILAPLRSVAEKHHVAVIMVNHLNRNTKGSSKNRSLGSGAFPQVCRVELRVAADPENPQRRLLLPVKNNLAWPAGLAYQIVSDENGRGVCQWEPDPVLTTIEQIES